MFADLLDLAVRAARGGARVVSARRRHAGEVRCKSTPTDPSTDTDRASEHAVWDVIAAERPHDGLLAEESVERASGSGLRWVVDPLDGTVNYLYGIPHYVVSVACERRDGDGWRTLVGVVHDVVRVETFTAVRGGGAWLDGAPLSVSAADGPGALVATGFSYAARSRSRQAAVLARVLPRVRDVRSSGSSALDLCWTAAGRYDGCYEDELFPWDWCAGALIVREAGGLVSPYGDGVLAAGPVVHDHLSALLV